MTAEEEIAKLGRDLHALGVVNSVTVPAKLYEMGWRKNPKVRIEPQTIPASVLQPNMIQQSTQIANPNQFVPRQERWMQR